MDENPFRFSGPLVKDDPVCGSTFVERTSITNVILKFVQQGEYVQIVGPHQSGRTTLALDLLTDTLSPDNDLSPRYIPVLISCEALMDACREGFVQTVLMRLKRVLKEYIKEEESQSVRSLLEDRIPNTLLDLHWLLVACGDELMNSTRYSAFIFLIDEIEALPDNMVVDVLRFFRSLFNHYVERHWESPYRVIILTTQDLAYWKLGRSSPYNVANVIKLEPFYRQELDVMLDDEHAGKKLKSIAFDESARQGIYRESGGHPYFIQRLCHILVKRYSAETDQVILSGKEVTKAVLEVFEEGDKSLQGLYGKAPAGSEEWQLCKRLVAGHREPFEADNPTIYKMVEVGAISDVNHCCQISTNLYERQILKRYFREEFTQIRESLTEKERLLLHVSCLQEILLNGKIRQLVLSKIGDRSQGKSIDPNEEDIIAELSGSLEKWLSEMDISPDMEEIAAYVDYYDIEEVGVSAEIGKLLSRVLIARFASE